MKKTSFLKGLTMAAVAFAAVLTSCTEEDFNIKVEKTNAKIYFKPSVIDPVTDATVSATFTGADPITGNPNIPAGSTTINATAASGATGSTTVNYEAAEAGTTTTYSPIIILSNGLYDLVQVGDAVESTTSKYGNVTAGHSHNGSAWFMNQSDYSAKFTAEWNETAETSVTVLETLANSPQLQAYLKTLAKEIKNEGTAEFNISAWAMFRTIFTLTATETTYNVVSKENPALVVAKIKLNNPLAKVDCKGEEAPIPGHEGHYQHGHSHGNGNNAGGGIGWAE